MHVVFCMWPHVHSGHTHTVSHVAHTQTHIDTGMVVPTLHVHTQLVHLCSHARGSARSRHTSAPTSVCLCTLTCLWTVKGADPPTSRAGPGAGLLLGVLREGSSWARLQPRGLTGSRGRGPFEPQPPPALQVAGPGPVHSLPGAALHRDRGLVSRWHVRIPVLQGGWQEQLRPSCTRTAAPSALYDMMEGRAPAGPPPPASKVYPARLPILGVEQGRRDLPWGLPTCWVTSAPPWAECGIVILTLQDRKAGCF